MSDPKEEQENRALKLIEILKTRVQGLPVSGALLALKRGPSITDDTKGKVRSLRGSVKLFSLPGQQHFCF